VVGTHRGLIDAETEAENIERGNRHVYSINYFQDEQIREGNRRARERQLREDLGLDQTSASSAPEAPSSSSGMPRVQQEYYDGTYGKEYQVSEYDVSTYNTSEYEVKPYSSVYEK
jgi:hypothetical protein